ncbi:MAG: cytochrome P450 [Caldilineaceae bacterium]
MTMESNYNLYSEEFKANPFPTYAQMREADPVCYAQGLEGTICFVTRRADVEAVLRDHKRFVKDWRNTRTPEERAQLSPEPPLERLLSRHMLNMDGADHTRLRSLVNKAFTTRMVQNLRGRVQGIADDLLDQVQARGHMDLIDEYAFPLPIVVISDLLGIPSADRDRFRLWSNTFIAPTIGEEEWRRAEKLMLEFTGYLRQVFVERRQEPRNDLITGLVHAEEAGDKLSEDELFAMVILLIVAGHETTVNLIGNGALALLRHPAQLAKLKAEPSLIESAVEELLRYDGPVDRATMRFAAEDVELGGQLIRRGQAVSVALTSANRDAAYFAQPDEVDIARADNRHLAFGFGVHYCVGAPLARMEGQIAINTLVQRLPNLRLAVAVEELQWGTVPIIRGMKHMPVEWE